MTPNETNRHDFGCTTLGSGSKGNASVIQGPNGRFLLDAGLSARDICARMADRGIGPDTIGGVPSPHSHTDHVRGCRRFADKFHIPAYMTPQTFRILEDKELCPERKTFIMPGSAFELCGVQVEAFSVSHDVDSVAYTFRCGDRKLGFATDLGFLNLLAVDKLKGCRALVLESNYDRAMLQRSPRPLALKRRIMSRQGHLSNDDALTALGELLDATTRHLVFAHVSEECNDRSMLDDLARGRLEGLGRADVRFAIASQRESLETIWVE